MILSRLTAELSGPERSLERLDLSSSTGLVERLSRMGPTAASG
jgi:hypothetical protein